MFSKKSKDTAFNMVNVDQLLGIEPEADQETEEPAPVIEKVSLAEINDEKDSEQIDKVLDILNEYLELTPEEKETVITNLFE